MYLGWFDSFIPSQLELTGYSCGHGQKIDQISLYVIILQRQCKDIGIGGKRINILNFKGLHTWFSRAKGHRTDFVIDLKNNLILNLSEIEW